MVDVGTPLKSSGRPNGIPHRPSGTENLYFSLECLCSVLVRWCILLTLWLTFGSVLVPLASFSFTFGIIFNLSPCFSHLPLHRLLFRLSCGCLFLFVRLGFKGRGVSMSLCSQNIKFYVNNLYIFLDAPYWGVGG